MRWFRSSTIVFLLAAGALSVATFSVKYRVQFLEDELNALDKRIDDDRRAIHILQAEWAHLNNPRRLRSLAKDYLALAPVTANAVSDFQHLPEKTRPKFPDRAEGVGDTDEAWMRAIDAALSRNGGARDGR